MKFAIEKVLMASASLPHATLTGPGMMSRISETYIAAERRVEIA